MSDEAKAEELISIFVCKNIPSLIDLYKKFGFNVLEKEYDNGELVQMIRVLDEAEIIG
ncbi:hypothetical protein WG909_14510 [Peptostreptococcaceae bacterium AGR-M142]